MTPLEPQKKVLVADEFLSSDHGEIACETCHGGNAEASKKSTAHEGLVPSPSLSDPEGACGDCHEGIAASAKVSLHATLAPFATILKRRAQPEQRPWKRDQRIQLLGFHWKSSISRLG